MQAVATYTLLVSVHTYGGYKEQAAIVVPFLILPLTLGP